MSLGLGLAFPGSAGPLKFVSAAPDCNFAASMTNSRQIPMTSFARSVETCGMSRFGFWTLFKPDQKISERVLFFGITRFPCVASVLRGLHDVAPFRNEHSHLWIDTVVIRLLRFPLLDTGCQTLACPSRFFGGFYRYSKLAPTVGLCYTAFNDGDNGITTSPYIKMDISGVWFFIGF